MENLGKKQPCLLGWREGSNSQALGEPGVEPPLTCACLHSRVFGSCYAVVPPEPYFQGCVFDQCYMPSSDMTCSSLELYALLCASHGVCIDWRGWTNHTCRECLLGHGTRGPWGSGVGCGGQTLWAHSQGLGFLEWGGLGPGRVHKVPGEEGVVSGEGPGWKTRVGHSPPAGTWGPRSPCQLGQTSGAGPGGLLLARALGLRCCISATQPLPALLVKCTSPVARPTPPTATGAAMPASGMHCPPSWAHPEPPGSPRKSQPATTFPTTLAGLSRMPATSRKAASVPRA